MIGGGIPAGGGGGKMEVHGGPGGMGGFGGGGGAAKYNLTVALNFQNILKVKCDRQVVFGGAATASEAAHPTGSPMHLHFATTATGRDPTANHWTTASARSTTTRFVCVRSGLVAAL